MRKLTEADFWSRVKRGRKSECWPWTGPKMGGGYGSTNLNCKSTTAHRIAYKLTRGDIPSGHNVLHRCDNPPCCNPEHLFTGTQKENLADMDAKGRRKNNPLYGPEHGRCKISTDGVRMIRIMRAVGMSQQSIADKFCIGQNHVSRILRGENRRIA